MIRSIQRTNLVHPRILASTQLLSKGYFKLIDAFMVVSDINVVAKIQSKRKKSNKKVIILVLFLIQIYSTFKTRVSSYF